MIRGQPSITKKINVKSYMLGLLLLGIALTPAQAKDGAIPVKNGETIAFLGDSITAEGRREDGYCQLVLQGLRKEGIETTAVFSGNPGNTSISISLTVINPPVKRTSERKMTSILLSREY